MSLYTLSLAIAGLAFGYMYYLFRAQIETIECHVAEEPNATYDYVIVGAGSAGAVLAARLSENPDVSVLVLEAGGEEIHDPGLKVPGACMRFTGSMFDWNYKIVPQTTSCLALKYKSMQWSAGFVLGGSSMINYMLYTRGSFHDYDSWADSGCTGWNYENVLPYFLKSEDFPAGNGEPSKFHHQGGFLAVSDTKGKPFADVFVNGGKELGYESVDLSEKYSAGFGYAQTTIRNGVRSSTAHELLRPAMCRGNLHVVVKSMVTKVKFQGKKAVGVEVNIGKNDGPPSIVYARREVILSAGALGSPKILQLSGVGPKVMLKKLKVPLVADLPVGNNLQNHPAVLIWVSSNVSNAMTPAQAMLDNLAYSWFRKGSQATPPVSATAFLSLSDKSIKSWPDIQIVLLPSILPGAVLGCNDSLSAECNGRSPANKGFTILVVLLRTKSKGSVEIASSNYKQPPVINPNYLKETDDVANLLRGIRLVEELLHTTPFSSLNISLDPSRFSLCGDDFRSDSYWNCYIRHLTMTMQHPTGTCKMGPINDPTTVVDPSLRVKGLENIRVVDGSIIPAAMSANLNAPVIMIAEKAADMIQNIDSVQELKKRR